MIALHFDTRRFRPAICAFTLVGWIAAGAQATPDTIPVQGYLTDEQGVPFDGEVSATLSLYTTWDAAEPVFTEDHALLVDNGHFTVYLGSEDGLELLLFSEADELFLGVKVGNDDEMQPRLPMGASPFAMAAVYAEDSETVGGMPPSAFAQNEHSHPFSQLDDVPADLLDGDDDTTYTVSAPLQMEGNEIRFSHPCEVGEVFKWTGAGWACAADETGSNLTGQSPVVIDGTVVGLTQSCAVNQILKWNGSQWLCQADQAFLPSVGTGLSLSGDVLQVDANIDDGSRYDARFAPFSHTHDFSSLENIPGDVLDGDADTTYTVALPLTMTDTKIGLTASCAAGEILKWDGQAWACGVDNDTLAELACDAGATVFYNDNLGEWECGSGVVDPADIDATGAIAGQVLTYDGAQVRWETPSAPVGSACEVQAHDNILGFARFSCGDNDLLMRAWTPVLSLAVGGNGDYSFACALYGDGSLRCWGYTLTIDGDMLSKGSGSGLTAFTAGGSDGTFACGIDAAEAVSCWGTPDTLLYNGLDSPPPGTFTKIAAGYIHVCALHTDQSIHCWGDNSAQQLDAPAGTFTHIASSENHSCALATDGAAHCWGEYGTSGVVTPTPGNYTAIATGRYDACAISVDQSISCWGDPGNGLSNHSESSIPTGSFVDITVTSHGACALDLNGQMVCWGANRLHGGAGTYASLAKNSGSTQMWCALSPMGSPHCYGLNWSDYDAAYYNPY